MPNSLNRTTKIVQVGASLFAFSILVISASGISCMMTKDSAGVTRSTYDLITRAVGYSGLQMYLHRDLPSRATLCITGDVLPVGLETSRLPDHVKLVATPADCANALVFQTFDITGDSAHISFQYPIEGIRCNLTLVSHPRGWRLVDSTLVEY